MEQILGRAAAAGAEVVVKPHVTAEIDKRGHPLFWAEYKSVQLFKVLFAQFDVTHIMDVTPGSGAAASAALAIGATYEGFCVNGPHKQWLENLMDSAIFALAVESKETAAAVGATQEHIDQIKSFFSGTVKDAKRYLDPNSGTTAGDADDEEGDAGSSGESE